MLEKIELILRDECKLDKAKPILVGVSGGPDSLCLMDLLRRAGYGVIVAHFNHKLRPEAEEEAKAVQEMAARFGLPFVMGEADVRGEAARAGLSIEEAARNLRYQFLFRTAHSQKELAVNIQAVAVGHTADDQVETVLMHFIRGAGLSGLKGMTYRTTLPAFDADIPIVRPLLDVWREETVAYCASQNLQPHYDPSNNSVDFLRNRVRHELIPTLETYNPKLRVAILRGAQVLASDHELLNETLDEWWKKSVIKETNDYVGFDLPFLSGQSIGLQRNLIRRAVERLVRWPHPGPPQIEGHDLPTRYARDASRGRERDVLDLPTRYAQDASRGREKEMGYSVVERAVAFLADAAQSQMDLIGGLRMYREGEVLYITKPEALPFDRWPQMPLQSDSIQVSVPGAVELAGGWRFSAEKWERKESAWEESSRNEDRYQVWLDAERLPESLELRVRRAGDVFEPLGMGGHSQKLSDFFVNVKLPQRARDRWPLLCAGDKVIWVPGYRPAEGYKLMEGSRRVVYFAVRHPKFNSPEMNKDKQR